MFTIITHVGALLVGFIAGALVYRNNRDKADAVATTIDAAGAKVKDRFGVSKD
jgi:hypothetical protein